ncbi:uncharacterized protein METZ01_LOCUS78193 [marine metagenome]|uniref:Uncharacterized protein n=1 Tax=marine metagenome TaxID=408172 RepID=A0A381UB23_9ZZZZ
MNIIIWINLLYRLIFRPFIPVFIKGNFL